MDILSHMDDDKHEETKYNFKTVEQLKHEWITKFKNWISGDCPNILRQYTLRSIFRFRLMIFCLIFLTKVT